MSTYVFTDSIGSAFLASIASVPDSAAHNEQPYSLAISVESDVTIPQVGSSYMLKLRYSNQSERNFDRSGLTTVVTDSTGLMIEKFTNNSDILVGGNTYSSITLPNIPNAVFSISCEYEGEEMGCNRLEITIPTHRVAVSDIDIPLAIEAEDTPLPTIETNDTMDEIYEPIVKSEDIVKTADVASRSVDFKIVSIDAAEVDGKIKVTFGFEQNDVYEIEKNLQYKYTVKDGEYEQSLIADIGNRTYKVGTVYYSSFYLNAERANAGIQVELDPQTQMNDPLRQNNLISFNSKIKGNFDIMITKMSSKIIEDEGKIKLYVEFKHDGGGEIDASDMRIKASMPYSDEFYNFEDVYVGYLKPNQIASYVAFLPLKTQNQKIRVEIDPEHYYADQNRENNKSEIILDGFEDSFNDLKLLNGVAKIVEEGETAKIKIYTEYFLDGKAGVTDPVDLRFTDVETSEGILYIENFNPGKIDNDFLYSTINYLPIDFSGKIIKIEIDASNSYNDPIRANNSVYLKLP